eukprot:TRINITY_DN2141_c0_g1_i1.p1 TRINITY_DN2141_c0_g1~~TRINITY_DN2141_c0_g1_i1.p1  ORF type:complete len:457 (+),score=86.49 TRINITY_DN2141_c0_g1_i1:39-1409(+)
MAESTTEEEAGTAVRWTLHAPECVDLWLSKSPSCMLTVVELGFDIPAGTQTEDGLLRISDILEDAATSIEQADIMGAGQAFKAVQEAIDGVRDVARGNRECVIDIFDPSGISVVEDDSGPIDPTNIREDSNEKLEGIASSLSAGRISNVVVLSGAGMSVAAGIPDFRSPGTGLYDRLEELNLPRPESVFDITFFRQHPEPFYKLAADMWPPSPFAPAAPSSSAPSSSSSSSCADATPKHRYQPTTAHHFIKLLSDKGVLRRNFTQIIDGLERLAGLDPSQFVEAHGTFQSSSCVDCHQDHSSEDIYAHLSKQNTAADDNVYVPHCQSCDGVVKPDIVFFGEALPSRFDDQISSDLSACDLLLVIGTSLSVEPFASLIDKVPIDTPRVLINRDVVGVVPDLRDGGVDGEPSTERTRGFQFGKAGSRDVLMQGLCDEGVERLAHLCGWRDALQRLCQC